MKVKSLSSSERFSASMAMRYWLLGNWNAAASILPETESVSPVSAEILVVTMMSPASALPTSVWSRPHIT